MNEFATEVINRPTIEVDKESGNTQNKTTIQMSSA